MKTVSGEVTSYKSISLKKAARTLSNFVSSDNGASPAFAAYLKRAAASFNELVQLHKECKRSGSEHKVKKQRSLHIASEGTAGSIVNSSDEGVAKEIGTNKKKDRQGVNRSGEAGRFDASAEVQKVGNSVGYVADVGGAGKKTKKKRENIEAVIINETYDNVVRKTRVREGKERKDEAKLEIEFAKNKESRKRKHESVTAKELDGSQEQHTSKKKKKRGIR